MNRRCILVGDVMMDVTAIIDSDIAYASDTPAHVTLQPGGVAANTAAWMATDGSPVTIVGCIGEDAFGASIARELTALGVDVHLQTAPGERTGTCVVIVDRRRERTMFPDAGANAGLQAEAVRALFAPECHVHLSGYTLLNPATRAVGLAILDLATDVGASLSLDPASAAPIQAQLGFMRDLLPRFDLLLANEDESAVLSSCEDPHAALEVLTEIVPTVVIKLGSRGVLARSTGMTVAQPALRHDVVDTTGAGDAFTAGFLPAWLRGTTLAEAVTHGQRLASGAVGRVGASPMVH